MSSDYLKLDAAPGLTHPGHPICDACEVEVELDDGWLCPSCGTAWPADQLECDGSDAALYKDWSGETLAGPACPVDLAWQVSHLRGPDRDQMVRKLTERTTR